MATPAQRHLMRHQSAQATAKAAPGSTVGKSNSHAHALIRAKLDADRRRLKNIQSIERKITAKRDMLPEYKDYVAGVMASGVGVQDEVLAYVMCWAIDVGDFALALPLAAYVLKHDLSLPDRFERTAATLIAEEPAEQALKAFAASVPFDVAALWEVFDLTEHHDMPDQVRAKLHFAIGRHIAATHPTLALDHMRKAVALNDKVGAKKDIEQLERQLKKSGASASTESPATTGT